MNTRDYNITQWESLGVNYWGITKAANSTIKSHLLKASGFSQNEWLDTVKVNKESLADYITPEQAHNNSLLNFTVIRHPLGRAVSVYKDLVMSRPERSVSAGLSEDMTLDDYFDFLSSTDDDSCDVHMKSISWFIKSDLQFVFKLENKFLDWRFNFAEAPNVVVNKSASTTLDLKRNHIKIVEQRYKEDFTRFDYDPKAVGYALNL